MRVSEIHNTPHSKSCTPIRSNATLLPYAPLRSCMTVAPFCTLVEMAAPCDHRAPSQGHPVTSLGPWAHVATVSSGGLSMAFLCVPVYVPMRSKSWTSFWIWGDGACAEVYMRSYAFRADTHMFLLNWIAKYTFSCAPEQHLQLSCELCYF